MYTSQLLDCTPGLNSKPFRSTYVEKAYCTDDSDSSSDGDVKPGHPLGAFREEQAMSRLRVSPPSLSSSSHTLQHNYTTQTLTHTVTLKFLQYTIQILIPHVMWSA